jgi:hypothetical protein
MKIAIFNNINHSYTGKLCKWATGYADYHVGITDEVDFWDQDLLFRKRQWIPRPLEDVTLFECPVEILPQELDQLVLSDVERFCIERQFGNIYGYRDYLGFGLRKLNVPFNINFKGVVCSGRTRDILYSKGWEHLGSPNDLEPAPADIRRILMKLNVPIIKQGRLD